MLPGKQHKQDLNWKNRLLCMYVQYQAWNEKSSCYVHFFWYLGGDFSLTLGVGLEHSSQLED